jgi:hypothetical protein
VICPAKTLQHEVAETAAHRIADQEGAGQHGDCRCDPEEDGQIRSPVIREAATNEYSKRHLWFCRIGV